MSYRLGANTVATAEAWLVDLETGEWHRGRVVASRQATVLRRVIDESRTALDDDQRFYREVRSLIG